MTAAGLFRFRLGRGEGSSSQPASNITLLDIFAALGRRELLYDPPFAAKRVVPGWGRISGQAVGAMEQELSRTTIVDIKRRARPKQRSAESKDAIASNAPYPERVMLRDQISYANSSVSRSTNRMVLGASG
jgi:hypothetical protein